MQQTNQQRKDLPEGKLAPDNIQAYNVSSLSYCDPEVKGANFVIFDSVLQYQSDNLVLAARDSKPCVRRFKEITGNDQVLGVVTQANWYLRKDLPKGNLAPDNTHAYNVGGLSYCDPEVKGANFVIFDSDLQPQSDNLVLAARDGKSCVRRFKEITENDQLLGVVTDSNWYLRRN